MQLRCVGCGAPMVLGGTHCPSCGRPADADGNGLPDALDRMVQVAAQNAVAAERAREASIHADGVRLKQRRMLENELRSNVAVPRTWFGVAIHRFTEMFLLMTFFGLTIGNATRLLSGPLGFNLGGMAMCLVQCPTCEPPGRAFNWNYRGPWQTNKGVMGSAYVCDNPVVDVGTLTAGDIRREPLNSTLQPYIVHNGWIILADTLAWALLLATLYALLGAGRELATLDQRRAELERRLGMR